jgi:hypothetical protein
MSKTYLWMTLCRPQMCSAPVVVAGDRTRWVMKRRRPDVLRISTPTDLIALVPPLLGFVPADSIVIVCLHGARRRVGLAMRFDLADAIELEPFVEMVEARVGREVAESVFLVVFSPHAPTRGYLPYTPLVDALSDQLDELLLGAFVTSGDRWWSYRCDDPCCDPLSGTPIDLSGVGATAVAAAYALAGQGVLPDRAAVVRSIALDLSAAEASEMRDRVATFTRQYGGTSQLARRAVVRVLTERLTAVLVDPRGTISTDDAAEFVALCDDVVVRDEVLIGAVGVRARERLLPVLRAVVRQVPPPHDAPVCAMLAWVSYAHGDGVVANVAVERSLATDADYSLAGLIVDAIYHQVPPRMLEEVMRGAARDLQDRSAAG